MFKKIKNIRDKSIIIRAICIVLLAIAVLHTDVKRDEISFFIYSMMGSNLSEGETLTTGNIADIIDKEGRFTLETGYSFTKYKDFNNILVIYNDEDMLNNKYLDTQLLKLVAERSKVRSFLGLQNKAVEQVKIFVFDGNRKEFQNNLMYYRRENTDLTDKIAMENVLFTATLPLSFYDLAELTVKQHFGNYSMPQWLSTGITIVACEKYSKGYSRLNISIESPGAKIDLSRLNSDRKYAKGYGHVLVDYIIQKHGKEKLLEVAESGSLETLNLSEGDFQNKFDDFKSNVVAWSDSIDLKDYLNDIEIEGLTEHRYGIANKCLVSDNFQVFYNDIAFPTGEEARRLADYLEEDYLFILNFLGIKPKQMPVVNVFLIENIEALNFAGQTVHQNYFTVKYYNGNAQNTEMDFRRNALHEFVHCAHAVKMSLIEKNSALSWLSEGLADSLSYRLTAKHYPRLNKRKLGFNLSTVDGLNCDEYVLDDSETEIFVRTQWDYYCFGANIIDYLYENKGLEAIYELLENPNDFPEIVGMPLKEFSRELAKLIADRYY